MLYNKQKVKIKAFERRILERKIKVYNFEVEGNHNYFVGDGVLVHNSCKISVQNRKKLKGERKQLKKHKKKLEDYINDPDGNDNKGFLKNATTQERRDGIINGRIEHLKDEIRAFEKNIEDILNGN